jgi:hypothetical protein
MFQYTCRFQYKLKCQGLQKLSRQLLLPFDCYQDVFIVNLGGDTWVSNTRDPPPPSELCPLLVFVQRFFSCLIADVFQPCMVLHVFSILQKSITMIFLLKKYFMSCFKSSAGSKSESSSYRRFHRPLA